MLVRAPFAYSVSYFVNTDWRHTWLTGVRLR
ncbi:hypothetical protein FHT76_001588 [Rhizobium sp. BK176]|nr:hypothetical protein [Rhizobium sp. BK176]